MTISSEDKASIQNSIDSNNLDNLNAVLSKYNKDKISSDYFFSDQTVFMYACNHGTAEIVKCFIEHGVYQYEIGGGYTELKYACLNEKYAAEVIPIVIDLVGKDQIDENGDPYGEYAEYAEMLKPVEILEKRNDQKAIEVLKSFM